ncbi:MAG: hypothetical protein QOD70_2356 [Frankiales bacterium]|nr:hypothetical protein [Frankiales bacterium]
MKIVYKPFGLLIGLLAGVLANMLFRKLWAIASRRDEVPGATQKSASWGEVAASAALQGAVMKGTRALVGRAGARGFEKATGTWPGDA